MLDTKYIDAESTGYTFPPGIYEGFDNILILKSSFPDEVNLNFTIDGIRLKSKSTTNKTIRFNEKSFF